MRHLDTQTRFQIADIEVLPSRNLIRGRTARVLEARVMDVLVCVANSAGEPVSTEQIIADVWSDRVVTQHVAYRAIAELRKAFVEVGATAEIIETIPRRGYRLAAPLQAQAKPVATVRSSHWIAITVISVIALALTALYPFDDAGQAGIGGTARVPTFRNLITQSGNEWAPAYTADGNWLLFNYQPRTGTNELWVARQHSEAQSPTRLIEVPGLLGPAVWAPTGRRLAFGSIGEQCLITIADVSANGRIASPPTQLATCAMKRPPSVAWAPDGQSILFTDRVRDSAQTSLRRIDLAGAPLPFDLAAPGPGGGDQRVLSHSESGRVMVARNVDFAQTDVLLVNIEDYSHRILRRVRSEEPRLAFSSSGEVLLGTSPRHTDILDPLTGEPTLWMESATRHAEIAAAPGQERYAVTMSFGGASDIQVAALGPGAPVEYANSTETDAQPSLANDRLYWVSQRSGWPEIWMASDGQSRQITHFGEMSEIGMLHASADGRKLLAFKDDSIIVVDVDAGIVRAVVSPSDLEPSALTLPRFPSWSAHSDIIHFSAYNGENWDIYALDLTANAGPIPLYTQRGLVSLSNDRGDLYYCELGVRQLYRRSIAGGDDQPLRLPVALPSCWDWTVRGKYIFTLASDDDRPSLVRIDPTNQSMLQLFEFPSATVPTAFSLSPRLDQLAWSHATPVSTDLMELTFAPR